MAVGQSIHILHSQLAKTVQPKSATLFRPQAGHAQIVLSLVQKTEQADGKLNLQVSSRSEINDVTELHRVKAESSQSCVQIYTIQKPGQFSPFYVSYELFQELLLSYNVFHHFLRSLMAFDIIPEENEIGFHSFRSQRSRQSRHNLEEFTHVIRRIERHNRLKENPWLVRQTGVYHKLTYGQLSEPNSTLIILAPSSTVQNEISNRPFGEISESDSMELSFAVHDRLVAESLQSWAEYLLWLEGATKHIQGRITVSDLEMRQVYIHTDDRKYITMYEDCASRTQLNLQTLVKTIAQIANTYQRYCDMSCKEESSCPCKHMVHEFEQYAVEAQEYLEQSRVLTTRVQSTARLLTHLLDHAFGRALKSLAQASHDESQNNIEQMRLNLENREESADVKRLTVLGLLFLPLTSVLSFFSTEFVKRNGQNSVQISRDVWILAAVVVPLTLVTFCLWWIPLQWYRIRFRSVPWLEKLFTNSS